MINSKYEIQKLLSSIATQAFLIQIDYLANSIKYFGDFMETPCIGTTYSKYQIT